MEHREVLGPWNSLCDVMMMDKCHYVCVCAQLYLPLSESMDCSPPGSSVHGIVQARILEWFAISFSRGSSQLRNQTWVSCIVGGFFTDSATRKAAYVIHLFKSTACTTMKTQAYALWVITMCQCRFISGNEWTTLVKNVGNRGGSCVGDRGKMRNLCIFPSNLLWT